MKAEVWLNLAKIAATILGSPLAGAAVGAAGELVKYLGKLKENALRTGEWTAAERKQVDERWAELESSHAWKTDAEGGAQ